MDMVPRRKLSFKLDGRALKKDRDEDEPDGGGNKVEGSGHVAELILRFED